MMINNMNPGRVRGACAGMASRARAGRLAVLMGSVLACSALLASPAQAFVLGKTRVIMAEGEVVPLPVISGEKESLLLIKAKGSMDVDGKVPAPDFMVSPPLFRLEKGGRSMLKLAISPGANKPQDRESVRYLTVTGIPSSNPLSPDRGKTQASMIIGQGAVIKVFYRPKGLVGTSESTWKSLQATRVPGGVELINPTPYHFSFSNILVDHHAVTTGKDFGMLPPFGRQVIGTRSVTKKEVEWMVTGDRGESYSGKTVIR